MGPPSSESTGAWAVMAADPYFSMCLDVGCAGVNNGSDLGACLITTCDTGDSEMQRLHP